MNKQVMVFDLDLTVINSEHRKASLPDGTLDLDHWIENSTPEKVAKDSLLPVVDIMRAAHKHGHNIIICTSRVLSDADFEFFMENNIPYHTMLSRPAGCRLNDADYKEFHLRLYAHNNGMSWVDFCETVIFWEDCNKVLVRMRKIGIATIDAQQWNECMSA